VLRASSRAVPYCSNYFLGSYFGRGGGGGSAGCAPLPFFTGRVGSRGGAGRGTIPSPPGANPLLSSSEVTLPIERSLSAIVATADPRFSFLDLGTSTGRGGGAAWDVVPSRGGGRCGADAAVRACVCPPSSSTWAVVVAGSSSSAGWTLEALIPLWTT
jgi:hypothetical protein